MSRFPLFTRRARDLASGDTQSAAEMGPEGLVASDLGGIGSGEEEFGRIEAFDGQYMVGWYFDLADRSQTLTVTFDDKVLYGVLADRSRMDVKAANPRAPERCGFYIDFDRQALLDRCQDIADLQRRLRISTVSGRQLAHCYSDPFEKRERAKNRTVRLSSFDGVDDGVVKGWATLSGLSDPVLIHVFVDHIFQGVAKTGLLRDDSGSLTGNYNAGFSFALSSRFLDGHIHTVSCRFPDIGEELHGSPQDVLLPSKSSAEEARIAALVESCLKMQDEYVKFRKSVERLAFKGASYFSNYTFYQDIVKTSRATRVLLKKKDLGEDEPLFSIVMPTYKTDLEVLGKAIDSVVAQTDPRWELVISDSATQKPIRDYLVGRAAADPRIRVFFNEKRLGISDNTNVAIRAAKGDYIGFMDHDDEIAPEAISLNRAAFATGKYDLIYSDEDKIDQNGNFVDPHYKTAFDLDLLLCMNYMCHFVTVKRSLLMETELNRRIYDGAQDWDLLLQLVRRIERSRVGHIPRVLYHWRMVPGSTALAIDEKSYAVDAGLNAVKDYLGAVGARADASRLPGGLPYVEVRWQVQPESKVSFIIPTKDRIDLVTNCVNSVILTAGRVDFEILIVDNNSTKSSNEAFEAMCEDARIRVLTFEGPFNYSAINNFAAREATGDFLMLLNNDVFFTAPGWLEHMLGIAQRPDVGAVGLKLLYPDNTVQHCGVVLGNGGIAGHAFSRLPKSAIGYFARTSCTHEVSAVTAACLLVRADSFFAVDGLDEKGLTVAFNDVDFCIKLQEHGLRNILVTTSFGYHAESVSRGYEDTLEKVARFEGETAIMQKRWEGKLTSDRFYSPNLDLGYPCYTVLDLERMLEQERTMCVVSIAR